MFREASAGRWGVASCLVWVLVVAVGSCRRRCCIAVDVAVLLYAVAVVGLVVSSPDWLVFVSRTVMG